MLQWWAASVVVACEESRRTGRRCIVMFLGRVSWGVTLAFNGQQDQHHTLAVYQRTREVILISCSLKEVEYCVSVMCLCQ